MHPSECRVLVAGTGSIGRRHIRNLHALGVVPLTACDSDPERLASVVREWDVRPFADLGAALAEVKPHVVFVCTPPVCHVPQALQAVRAGAHVFVEKPLSHSLDGVDELVREAKVRQRVVQVGYNLRFHPGLQMLRRLLDGGAVGRVLWAQAEVGQYLPDWRPEQNYRQSYTARRDLGGGIILDASHELDYVVWLLGRPTAVTCLAGRVSDLDVDVEDCATVLLRFPNGAQADVHMDFVQRGYSRSCKLAGQTGTLVWDDTANQVRRYDGDRASWESLPYSFEDNQMYVAEVEHFLGCVASRAVPAVDLEQGRQVLELALAAHRSAERGERISLP